MCVLLTKCRNALFRWCRREPEFQIVFAIDDGVVGRQGRFEKARRSGAELNVGLLQGLVWPQPSHHVQPPDGSPVEPIALGPQTCLRADGNGDIERASDLESAESGGCYADDIDRPAV